MPVRALAHHPPEEPAAARLRSVTGSATADAQPPAGAGMPVPAADDGAPVPAADDGAPVPAADDGAPEPAPAPPAGRLLRLARAVQLDRPGAIAVVAVCLVAALVAAVGYLRARPAPMPVAPPVATSAPSAAASGAATTSIPGPGGAAVPSAQPALVVDVAGRVRRPGVVRLPTGSRVIDALRAAGGPLPGTRLGLLNLASRLIDGEQIVVGARFPGAAQGGGAGGGTPSAATGPGAGAPVDLNAASAGELDALPGVGPVLAERIVDYRTAHGAFRSVDELEQVPGIGPSKMADLRELVTV
ncbi:MAG: helix-hairpin-helix domain-containing protein [Frankiaceae bacterium]